MKKYLKYILPAVVVIIIILISFNIGKLSYGLDTIRGIYINFFSPSLPEQGSFTIINPEVYKKYKKAYSDLPSNASHCGNFLIYTALDRISVKEVSSQMIRYTNYYRASNLRNAIKELNVLKNDHLVKNQTIIVPGPIQPFIRELKNEKRPEIIKTNALYFTGSSAGSTEMISNIRKFREYGINSAVIDVKDVGGEVNYYSKVELVKKLDLHEKRTIDNLDLLIREMKQNKIYVIARIAVFRDHLLLKKAPELAIKSKSTGRAWSAGSKELWCDPTNKTVQDYNIALAVEAAELGADEIQFDYIRYPTHGDMSDARYSNDFGALTREKNIENFLMRAAREIRAKNANVSIDIFGVVAWGKEIDIQKTGQRIELLSAHCDVISPMLYPSHFNDDFDGYSNPGDHPYYFIKTGCEKVLALSRKGVIIRPRLQAFKWRTSNYNANYIREQMKASDDSGAYGYLFWNAGNQYDVVYRAIQKSEEPRENKKKRHK